jgi:anti-anti-sigma factor
MMHATLSADMKLQLVSIEKEGLIRAATDGNITAADFTAEGKNPLETLLGLTWSSTRLMLDFSKTSYIDSSAIGWLIGTSRAFRDGGGQFVIHSVQPAVRQIMDVLRVGRVVPMAADETEARKIVTGATA